jgi:hypothetical protein
VENTPYRNSTYNRLPEDEPSGSKQIEDIIIKKLKYQSGKRAFCWFVLYNYIKMHSAKKRYNSLVSVYTTVFAPSD